MKKLCGLLIAIASSIHATTSMDPKELILHEIATVKENPDKKYVYLSNDVKKALTEIGALSLSVSREFDQLSSYIRNGGTFVEFDLVSRVITQVRDLLAQATLADETAQKNVSASIEEYQAALENGQALISVNESVDETTQKRTLRITSGLIVVDFVKLFGNLDVTNNIIVGGALTIEGATYLEGTTHINNNLIVSGTISGSTGSTFNSLTVNGPSTLNGPVTTNANSTVNGTFTVNGPSFLNGVVNVSPSLFINGKEVFPGGGGGSVSGPVTSTTNAICLFQGTSGNIIKQSPAPATIDNSNNLAGVNNITASGNISA